MPRIRPQSRDHGPESLSAVVLLRWYQGSVSLASIPPAVSWPGASFPPRGPSGRFPRFTGTTRRSESPPPVPPHFVAFVWRYPGRTRGSLPRSTGAPAAGLELVTRCSRRDSPRRWRGLPGSWRTPALVPCSPTPAGSQAPGRLRRCDAAFRQLNNVGSRDDNAFGAQSHGPFARCLRFAVRVTPAPRKTRFRPLAKLCRTGLVTRRVPTKGFRLWLPPFPSFPGALSRRSPAEGLI